MGAPYGFSQQNISRYYSKKFQVFSCGSFFWRSIFSQLFFENFHFFFEFFLIDQKRSENWDRKKIWKNLKKKIEHFWGKSFSPKMLDFFRFWECSIKFCFFSKILKISNFRFRKNIMKKKWFFLFFSVFHKNDANTVQPT